MTHILLGSRLGLSITISGTDLLCCFYLIHDSLFLYVLYQLFVCFSSLTRISVQMWPDLIAKSKEGGADVIQTYVFWNGHEPVRGQVQFVI